jgi:lipopolysaccharide heptosyltransferase II
MIDTQSWEQARHILCIRLDAMGDVLMCTPAMRALRQGRRERSLTLLSSDSGVALAPFIPELDAAISYGAPWVKAGHGQAQAAHVAMIERLRKQQFDAAVIFTSYSQSALPAALLCFLAGIPLRLAYSRENPYYLLSDRVPDPEPEMLIKHEVRRQLDLVAEIGCSPLHSDLSFEVQHDDLVSVQQRLSDQGVIPDRPWILLHPGASAASRRYPPEHWAAVAHLLSRDPGCPLVFTGSQEESTLINEIRRASGAPALSLAGRLTLGQLGAAIALAEVVVSNNTGPAHLAAAIGTPVVDIYALTNPQHTPWNVSHRTLFHDVPCRFCYKSVCPEGHHDCLRKLAPAKVAAAVRSLMDSGQQHHFLLKSLNAAGTFSIGCTQPNKA